MFLTIAAAIFVLGILIFVHELGHFLAAKSVNVAVLRFSFGLGPKTPLVWKRGETEYCLSWIPLGGYVKMAGLEDEPMEGEAPPAEELNVPYERTFDSKPLWARVYIISAGVVMNMLFAVATYAVLTGIYGVTTDTSTTVGEVRADSLPPAAASLASLRAGDRIVRINGDTVTGWGDVREGLLTGEAPIQIEVAGRAQPIIVNLALSRQEERVKMEAAVIPSHDPVVAQVVPDRPAQRAGLRAGDRIVGVNGATVPAWENLVDRIELLPDTQIALSVMRGDSALSLSVTSVSEIERLPGGNERRVGKIGISGPFYPHQRYGVVGSIGQGFKRAAAAGGMVLFTLKGLLTGQLSPRDLGGPILVGQLSGEAARLGWDVLFGFMALFSMNLAILNLLPIPVLDGGHLMFMLIEAVRRKPLSVVARQRLTTVGLFLLLAIMLLAVSNDVIRVVSRMAQ